MKKLDVRHPVAVVPRSDVDGDVAGGGIAARGVEAEDAAIDGKSANVGIDCVELGQIAEHVGGGAADGNVPGAAYAAIEDDAARERNKGGIPRKGGGAVDQEIADGCTGDGERERTYRQARGNGVMRDVQR